MNKLIGIILCVLPVISWAEQGDLPIRASGYFVGIGVGSGQAEIQIDSGNVDGNDTSYKIFAGYRWWDTFMPWDIDLGLEVAYVDLGSRTQAPDELSWKMSNKGIATDLIGYLPVSRHFEIIGKAGLFFSDTKLSNESIDIDSGSDSNSDLLLGMGIGYQTGGRLSASAEIESYGLYEGAWLLSLSATYQFK